MKAAIVMMLKRALKAAAAALFAHLLQKWGIGIPGGEVAATVVNTGGLMGLEKGIREAWPTLKGLFSGGGAATR